MQDYVLGKDVLIYFKWDVGRRYVEWRMVAGQEPGMEEEHGQDGRPGVLRFRFHVFKWDVGRSLFCFV